MNATASPADRNKIRSQLLKHRPLRREKLTINGVEVELRQMTIKEVLDLSTDESGSKDVIVDTLIKYCYVPGTDERVFEEADKDILLEWPVEGWLKDMTEVLAKLSGGKLAVENELKK